MRLCPTFWPLPNENFVEDTVDMDASDYALCVRASWTDIYIQSILKSGGLGTFPRKTF